MCVGDMRCGMGMWNRDGEVKRGCGTGTWGEDADMEVGWGGDGYMGWRCGGVWEEVET